MQRAPTFEAARAVFAALSELHLADSTRVYNGLLGAAGRAGRWREAQALYGQMQADEVPASLESHTALIQACVVGRALDHALHIFEHLVAGRSAHEAVPASIATYNHLIHACHQVGWGLGV
jgi:pentatricopeptide repeat protein